MAEGDRTRLEIAFEGQQVLSVHVPAATADELDRALAGDADGSLTFEAEDGRYTLSLPIWEDSPALVATKPAWRFEAVAPLNGAAASNGTLPAFFCRPCCLAPQL